MALRDSLPFLGRDPGMNQNGSGTPGSDPMLGHTAPAPDEQNMPMPRAGAAPIGQSGRANFWGLPQWDELNRDLVGARGLQRFGEMYRTDPHVRRLVLAAWSPVVAGTWTLEPYGGDDATAQDRQIAQDIWWLLTQWMTPNFIEHLLEIGPLLLRSGFTPCEQIWSTVKRNGKTLLAPRSLQVRLPTSVWRWWQDDFGQLTHIGQMLPNKSDIIIPASDLLYFRLGAEGDNWMGTSLLRHAYKPWFIKDKLERIDMIGQERKAVGIPVVYPPVQATKTQRDEMEALLSSLHMSEAVYILMPGPKAGSQSGTNAVPQDEWLIEVIQFDSSSGAGIMDSIAYHQTGIASSFLTDFLELGHHQVGARATADVQEDPFLTAINGALLPPIVPPWNRLIDRIRRLNWDSAEGSPTLNLTLNDEASLSEIAAYVTPLVQAEAIQVDPELEDYLRDRAGMPPANAQIRQQHQDAQQAGFEAQQQAAKMATTGELPGEEPAGANTDPAKTGFDGEPNPSEKGPESGGNPIAGAVKNTGDGAQKPAAGKKLSRAQRRAEKLRELDDRLDAQLDDIDREMDAITELDASTVIAAGICVQAQDTGRVLVVRRTPDDTDDKDVLGSYEFPGGKLDPDDRSPWVGAAREFTEETGAQLPGLARMGDFTSPNGAYRCYVVRILHETDVMLGHHDKAEVSATQWLHPAQLAEGETSPRLRALLPHVNEILERNPIPTTLDAPAPASSGTQGGSGLQMVPQVAGDVCACERPHVHDGVCSTCGKPARKSLDAPAPIGVRDRVRRVKGDLEQHGPAGSITAQHEDQEGATVHDVDWDDGTSSKGVHDYEVRKLDAAPTARWFDRLLSQDQLKAAFDGCRDHAEAACREPVLRVANRMASQATQGLPVKAQEPPQDLIDAISDHYSGLYQLGQQTVGAELEKQRTALGRTLDLSPSAADAAATAARVANARLRGEHSARNIVAKITETLGRGQISALKDPDRLAKEAQTAGVAQLHKEALSNVAAQVNDGRNDAGQNAPGVIGAIYTSVLDGSSCDACVEADTGQVLSPSDAIALGPPNPDCAGADYCRCALLWVMSDDPAAMGMS